MTLEEISATYGEPISPEQVKELLHQAVVSFYQSAWALYGQKQAIRLLAHLLARV